MVQCTQRYCALINTEETQYVSFYYGRLLYSTPRIVIYIMDVLAKQWQIILGVADADDRRSGGRMDRLYYYRRL
jgi:hypothetical protein